MHAPSDRMQQQTAAGHWSRLQQLVELVAPDGQPDGVHGLLLYGEGGVGKSTLAQQLAAHSEQQQLFPGGVFFVSVQPQLVALEATAAVADDQMAALPRAQKQLLRVVCDKQVPAGTDRFLGTASRTSLRAQRAQQYLDSDTSSLDKGAAHLRAAFRHCRGSVLLLIDNVPEGPVGIDGLLPSPLTDCLPSGSRVVFMSRLSSAAASCSTALPGASIQQHHLQPLSDEAARSLLLARGVHLTQRLLEDVLLFCGGLPLLLTVVASLWAGDNQQSRSLLLDAVCKWQQQQCAVGLLPEGNSSLLTERLRLLVDRLNPDLRSAWLDVAMLFSDGDTPFATMELLYGKEVMAELSGLQLVQQVMQPSLLHGHCTVAVPSMALLELAHSICRPGLPEFRVGYLNPAEAVELSRPKQIECAGYRMLTVIEGGCLSAVMVERFNSTRMLHVVLESIDTSDTWLAAVGSKCKQLQFLVLEQPPKSSSAGHSGLPQPVQVGAHGTDTHNCLQQLPESFVQLSALRHLQLRKCSKLQRLPESFGQLAALQHLQICNCDSLQQLPESFGQLAALQHLQLSNCARLQRLPESFGQLAALERLEITGRCLNQLPESFGQLAALQHLELCSLTGNNFWKLPDSFGQLPSLQCLKIDGYRRLQQLPQSFGQLPALQHLRLSGCHSLQRLPESFGQLSALQRLELRSCSILQWLPKSFGQLSALQHLQLSGCNILQQLPESFAQLSSLQHLELSDCYSLQQLPESFGQLSVLQHLELRLCNVLQQLPESLGQLSALQHLELMLCRNLQKLPESLGKLSALQHLEISDCNSLQELPESAVGTSAALPGAVTTMAGAST